MARYWRAVIGLLALAACSPGEPSRSLADATACEIFERDEPNRPALVCIGARQDNWRFVFAYPAAAARIPALEALLRSRAAADRNEAAGAFDYASEHPDLDIWWQTTYSLEADVPGLVSLSHSTSQYAGGAHPWHATDTLIWDSEGRRAIRLADLFEDAAAAEAEIRSLMCPVLDAARKRRNPRYGPLCPQGLDGFGLVEGAGNRVASLVVRYDELDGYAGGRYVARVPVTSRLLALTRERWRASFAVGTTAAVACGQTDHWNCD